MGNTIINAPSVEHYTNVSDFMQSTNFNLSGWLYKIGRLCFICLTTNWGGYSGNTEYNFGTLKPNFRPVETTALPAFIDRQSTGINAPTFVTISTSGTIVMTTGNWNADGYGYPNVWACYFCEK